MQHVADHADLTIVILDDIPFWNADPRLEIGMSKLRCSDRVRFDEALLTLERDYHVVPLQRWAKPWPDGVTLYVALFRAADLEAVRAAAATPA